MATHRCSWLFLTWVAIAGLADVNLTHAAEPARLELAPGNKVAIVGNTLADRMQHRGHFETLLHARFPRHRLVVRNLGFSGDELTLRLRSQGFGSPDEHLKFVQADVVLAFFGYNESFAGAEGLPKFKQDLAEFVDHTLAEKYNGSSAPKLVLFSPIAHEDLGDPHLPNGQANNERLALYTSAMAEVAAAKGVQFVDLFAPSQQLYAQNDKPLTINGIHLNTLGDELIAGVMLSALAGDEAPAMKADALAQLKAAVLDKNTHWHARYRTTDGYSIYGGRADLKFVDGQTNRVVMQRELEILAAMTANRDKRVWALATGTDLKVDDSNTPEFIPVVTNKPGPLPGGKHVFLGGEESIGKMTVAKGMRVNLVASEEMFPELINPVQMAFDTKGRLWVATWESYPHWKPKDKLDDRLLILEDTDGDGRADKCKTFVTGLHNPTGFEFWNGGVLVAMAPELVFLKDTDGDDKADLREQLLHGLDSADTHHTSNSFTFDPGGAIYFQEGTFHHSQVETPYGPPVRLANAGVFRFEPRTKKFGVYVSYGFANPHGHAFDDWGQDIVVDGTGSAPFHAALFSGHVDFPAKHPGPPMVYKPRTRPCPGIEVMSSRHFPDDMQNNLLVGNVIGMQGLLQYKFKDQGASFGADEVEPIFSSSDPNFRPCDFEIGPDGAIYFVDWQNPIIGHMQHNLRDPSRDRLHGRVYRVTYEGRPLSKSPQIAGAPVDQLLALLKHPELRVRSRVRIELSGRGADEVLAGADKWLAGLDPADPRFQHDVLEALWVNQQQDRVNVELLERVLRSPDFRARAAAVRVLCYWRDRVPSALDLLRHAAADEHPRVRLEAVRAASFFTEPEAIEVALIAADKPEDEYLQFVRNETQKTLERHWKRALAANQPLAFNSDAGKRFYMKQVNNERLLAMPRSRDVCLELLRRPGLLDEQRAAAVNKLAELDHKTPIAVILTAIGALDSAGQQAEPSLVFDLVRQLTSRPAAELTQARAELESLATGAKQPIVRQVGFAALVGVDRSADNAWKLASRSPATLVDLVEAVSLVSDASLQAGLYARIEPLLAGLPAELASSKSDNVLGQFVRIELPKRGTLTLAEVEITSGGQNVARGAKATQKNSAHGGDAGKAIDGNRSGEFGSGGQTHTEENTPNPWWEVDLGRPVPIEAITVFNRTDGYLGMRLNGFKLTVLDSERKPVFTREKIEAPRESVSIAVSGGDPALAVRHAAMRALTSVRGQEAKTFGLIAPLVANDADRIAAIRALQRLNRADWPKDQAPDLAQAVLAYVRKLPVQQRTTGDALAALEFGDALATLLPAEAARKLRGELSELGVRVIRVGTLFERMAYDQDVLAVKAGKPVEFVFENSDLMPHNFVIVKPGTLETIGQAAEASAQTPEAAQRQYVPQSPDVLLASPLLQPRGSEKLSFTAPTEPGVYPFVCTYPGHWRRMYGALYVVEDLDAYLENPESYLASHPLEVKDALLKDRRPRTEWKLDDLAEAVGGLKGGRNFGTGKQMFQVANCVACHKLNGTGTEFGPDLAKLDDKFHSLDVLKELIDPSARINEKFQSYLLELESGQTVTGLIVKEDANSLQLIENPLAKAQPIEIKLSDISARQKSKASLMPKGLLDKLSRDEILDLIAYVLARGKSDSPLFEQGHGHAGHAH